MPAVWHHHLALHGIEWVPVPHLSLLASHSFGKEENIINSSAPKASNQTLDYWVPVQIIDLRWAIPIKQNRTAKKDKRWALFDKLAT